MTNRQRAAYRAAIHGNLAASVRRLAYGAYLVPSTSSNLVYRVSGRHGVLACSCPAGAHGHPCKHAAAILIRRTQEQAKREAARWREARMTPQEVA